MATTCSWTTAAAALASRANRLRAAPEAASCGANTLIATTRFNAGSVAFRTRPIPPWPSRSVTSYGPIRPKCAGLSEGPRNASDSATAGHAPVEGRPAPRSCSNPRSDPSVGRQRRRRWFHNRLLAASRSSARWQDPQASRWLASSACCSGLSRSSTKDRSRSGLQPFDRETMACPLAKVPRLTFDALDFPAQPCDHPALVLVDRPDGQPERLGHDRGTLTLDPGLPERLPNQWGELAPNPFGHPLEQPVAVLFIDACGRLGIGCR